MKIKIKKHVLRFRAINRDILLAIRVGTKKIETRAGSPAYSDIKKGDVLLFVCGKDRFEKPVNGVRKFKSIKALHKVYSPIKINPNTKTVAESEKVYYGFPGYRERIQKYGLIAFEL